MNKTLLIILIFIALELLSGLMIWGIGNLIIWAFGLTFTFTFWMGLCIAIVLTILSGTFK